jgi:hypothetical protein
MGLSADGVPIILHLPEVLHKRGNDELYSALMEYGSVVPLQIGTGADKKKKDKEDAYHIVEGQLAGNTKLVTVWHAVGHSVSLQTIFAFVSDEDLETKCSYFFWFY